MWGWPTTLGFASLLTLLAALHVARSADAASPSRQCRKACRDEIPACVGAGGHPRACRRSVLGRCKREGVTACQGQAGEFSGALAGDCTSPAVIPAQGGTFSGATSGTGALAGSCGSSSTAPEQVFQWTPAVSGRATIQTCGAGTTFDTVLYLRSGACASGPEMAAGCNDDACTNATGMYRASRLTPSVAAGQTYFIVVDGYGGAQGIFSLAITPPASTTTTTADPPATSTSTSTTTTRPPTTTTPTTTRPPTTTTTTASSSTTTTTIPSGTADEIHWTVTGQTSVSFDWRGSATVIRYGLTSAYGQSATGQRPSIVPFSSSGPFWEAHITGLQENTVYHYSVGGGSDHTFKTPPPRGGAGFTVYAEGDIGSSRSYPAVAPIQALIAAGRPNFVLALGDLTYANANGEADVDQHFNDVMVWSQDAAYEVVWGNHEWDGPTDNLKNYKGRFDFANPQTDPASPSVSCCGEDWHWFDYGNTRFIAYPEPWDNYGHWFSLMSNTSGTGIMDQAQADPNIRFIVTFGHRPAWSTGVHPGDTILAGYTSTLHATHSKYVLNLNGHSHDYERSNPTLTGGVTHITSGAGGGSLENVHSSGCLWQGCPPPAWSVKRYMHFGVVKLVFGSTSISGQLICGPAGGGSNDVTCNSGDVMDSFTIQ